MYGSLLRAWGRGCTPLFAARTHDDCPWREINTALNAAVFKNNFGPVAAAVGDGGYHTHVLILVLAKCYDWSAYLYVLVLAWRNTILLTEASREKQRVSSEELIDVDAEVNVSFSILFRIQILRDSDIDGWRNLTWYDGDIYIYIYMLSAMSRFATNILVSLQ